MSNGLLVFFFFSFSTEEVEAGGTLWILGLPGLYSESQVSQDYVVRSCLKQKKREEGKPVYLLSFSAAPWFPLIVKNTSLEIWQVTFCSCPSPWAPHPQAFEPLARALQSPPLQHGAPYTRACCLPSTQSIAGRKKERKKKTSATMILQKAFWQLLLTCDGTGPDRPSVCENYSQQRQQRLQSL